MSRFDWFWLLSGPLCLLLCSLWPIPGLSPTASQVVGVALWMVLWWVRETVPLAVTSLLPMILFPLFGISSADAATAPYANPLIFMFFGGFCLSIALEKTGLHQHIAQATLARVGRSAPQQLAALMAITAFLSMWMSNTATAVMMLPIALAMIASRPQPEQPLLAPAMLLGVAYASSIGGIATLIGTPPNALLAAFVAKTYEIQLGFGQWMLFALPLAASLLLLCWAWLSFGYYRLHRLDDARRNDAPAQPTPLPLPSESTHTSPLTSQQRAVAVIFALTALCWIIQPLLSRWTGLAFSDTVIALCAALALFIWPVQQATNAAVVSAAHSPALPRSPVLSWHDCDKLPWGVLLLFGGGLSLAAQLQHHGVSTAIAQLFSGLDGVSAVLVIASTALMMVFLTELTSNTAVAAAFLPILGPVAESLGLSPLYLLVPAALAASLGFMMPVGTPPNAIVFASGKLPIRDMLKAGFVVNLLGVCLLTLWSYGFIPWWLGL